jgi:hypothetical protein
VDVELSVEESGALRKAMQSYLSDLRMEISDTDNPAYRRDLRDERATLEGILTKLDDAATTSTERDPAGRAMIRIVGVWVE